jgi:hypothetical protein
MGYWGYGNFDGDDPRDFLADMVTVWERVINHGLAGELEEAAAYFGPEAEPYSQPGQEAVDRLVMPTVEIMTAVAEKFECEYLPSSDKVAEWSAAALRIYDEEGHLGWGPDDDRRRVIAATFDRLLRLVEVQSEPGPNTDDTM